MTLVSRAKSILDALSTVAVLGASVAIMWTLLTKPSTSAAPRQVESVEGVRIDADRIRNVTGNGPVAIVEFSDFQCPFCRRHARETLPAILKSMVASGDVRYAALHFPIEETHPLALAASEAVECAGVQGQFWEMHEQVFSERHGLTNVDLMGYAKELSLDLNRFDRCLATHETLDVVRSDQAEGRRIGVSGTPSFFIGTVSPDGSIEIVKRIRGAAAADVFINEVKAIKNS